MKISSMLIAFIALVTLPSAANDITWRSLNPEHTVLMTLPHGKVVIELAPQFSPNHVQQFVKLSKKGHYDGNKFYRVIDGFVAQAGPKKNSRKELSVKKLNLEGEWSTTKSWQFTPVQSNDLFALQTGFKDGFAIGHNANEKKAWLTHCPGVIAMARSNQANSASSHFYIVNGQAPRYLDRLMTIFGRVVYGMEHVQSIVRTSVIEGDKAVDNKNYTPIVSMKLMSDVAKAEQILIEVEATNTDAFKQKLAKRKARPHDFFFKKPPPVLDICQTPVKARRIQ
ncbi:peptidylprolyl isomerase [Thalassotalea sp. PLHSN55]|uniref:peptidylprolyl isomerase n=1 Tax=Thalassotalea sp. PLHSN55 TaxID=3435888 RepID=UPI003F86ADED